MGIHLATAPVVSITGLESVGYKAWVSLARWKELVGSLVALLWTAKRLF